MTSPPTASLVSAVEGKERPIIFSAPMVRAILAGRKTQTRRVLKQQPDPLAPVSFVQSYEGSRTFDLHTRPRFANGRFIGSDRMQIVTAPHAPGDRLWVKEEARRSPDVWTYTADGSPVPWPGRGDLAGRKRDICNSMFLPRSCSRLTLEVIEVRVERLQDISEADAQAEGAEPYFCAASKLDTYPAGHAAIGCDHRAGFWHVWNSIHGKDAWDANPWVAAITFRPLVSAPLPTGQGEVA